MPARRIGWRMLSRVVRGVVMGPVGAIVLLWVLSLLLGAEQGGKFDCVESFGFEGVTGTYMTIKSLQSKTCALLLLRGSDENALALVNAQ